MGERDLEHVMREFYAQRVNLLVCSTIIETGIDVPTANTIIIERADRFGLAQLHQLRGRVGRSHHQAYAYLLTPPEEALSAQAKKRLEAIQMMEDLGAGFYLAMHDLEIRGAGEVLGESQSGEMQEVGFQLYADMLRAAVSALRAGREPDLVGAARRHHRDQPARAGAPARRPIAATCTSGSCSTSASRTARATEELETMQEELVDRFGGRRSRRRRSWHATACASSPSRSASPRSTPGRSARTLQFVAQPPFDAGALILLVQRDGRIRFAGPDRMRIERAAPTLADRVALIRDFLGRLR